MICYKIRSKANPELFVSGTPSYNSYEKTGRIFPTLGKLRSFLTVVMNSEYRSSKISEWEVVEVEMVVKEVKAIHEVLTAKKIKELIMK